MKPKKTVRALTRPDGRTPASEAGIASRTIAARATRTAAHNYEEARRAAARREFARVELLGIHSTPA
ncbi:MAG: hypothetical protein JHD16_00100 [Solirubrobacteraceae bacterium]|nr:hypothetical protein [Solirubrobacteraceae bacterium]